MTRLEFKPAVRRLLWVVAVLDAAAVAWMAAAGEWLSTASTLTSVVTLGGRDELVLALSATGFLMLAGLALLTDGFTSVTRVHVGLTVLASAVSASALAGALSTLLLLVLVALLLGFVTRRRR